jgi:exopolysaccharide biosynthesis polyprenyl glycosylphosphotransferase
MITFRRRILLGALKLFDVALMMFSFAVASLPVLYQGGSVSFAHFLSLRIKVGNFVLFAVLLLVWHVIFVSFGLYHSKRLSTQRAEVIDLLKATSLGTLSIFTATILFRIRMVPPAFLAVFWTVSTITAVTSRYVLRSLLHRIRIRGRNLRNVVIVGTNRRAIEFARKVEANPGLGYRILGFVDQEWPGMEDFRKTGYSLACDLESFPTFLRHAVVDEVIITLPIKSFYFEADRMGALCEEQGIITRFLSSIFNLKLARSRAEEFGDESLITLYSGAAEGWSLLIKRLLDISISLVLLILLAPLFLVTALIIQLTSPGPVFFAQERFGLNKRRFRVYKFRTMVRDAERMLPALEHLNEVSGPVFKIKNDPRITPIGGFLRKTSMDELPQLFNVLRGDMSLVGPRPLPVRDYQGLDQDWQRRRFSIRPGITCLWQINGRSSISFERWMELDMQYIDKWSLWLDLQILIRTIPAVLKGTGAA